MSVRSIVRWLVDFAALFVAFVVTYAASKSLTVAAVAVLLLAVYSSWCYSDGYCSGEAKRRAVDGDHPARSAVEG